jgi:hypothetical protein
LAHPQVLAAAAPPAWPAGSVAFSPGWCRPWPLSGPTARHLDGRCPRGRPVRRGALDHRLGDKVLLVAPFQDGDLCCQRVDLLFDLDQRREAIRAHNNGIHAEVQSYAEEVAGRLREEFDQKSEGWQAGEKGTAVREWIEEWEELAKADELDEIEAEVGDTLESIAEPTIITAEYDGGGGWNQRLRLLLNADLPHVRTNLRYLCSKKFTRKPRV